MRTTLKSKPNRIQNPYIFRGFYKGLRPTWSLPLFFKELLCSQ
nr:MAG TPA: hypothetical protein [Caudoviricetes sp.]